MRQSPLSSTGAVKALLTLALLTGTSALATVGVNVSFSPNAVTISQPSTLTLTLLNPNTSAASAVGLTSTLPTPVQVASPAGITNTCGGTVTATAGTASISLSGGNIAASAGATPGSCVITVNVVSGAPGTYLYNVAANSMTSSNGTNSQGAQATLAVGSVALITGSIAFSNPSLHGNATPTTMTITLQNPNAVTLTGNAFVMSIIGTANLAPSPNFATTCTGSPSITGSSGSPALLNVSGVSIAPNASCTISADVIARDPNTRNSNTYTQTIPAGTITNTQGGSNLLIQGNVAVQTGGFVSDKSFNPSTIVTGNTATLTYTFTNYNATPINGVTFVDTLPQPSGGTLVIANPPAPVNTCGGDLIAANGATTFSYGTVTTGSMPGFTGGAVGGNNCQVQVTVRGTNPGMSSVSVNDQFPGATWSGITASSITNVPLTITPQSVITGSKAFSGTQVQLNTTPFNMTITLRNASTTAATITSLSDALTTMGPGFTYAGTAGALGGTCGSSTTSATGATTLAISGGMIAAANGSGPGTCTIIVPINAAAGAPVGTSTNRIAINGVVTSQGNNLVAITGNVNLGRALAVNTSWSPATVVAGQSSRATIRIQRAAGAANLTGIGFIDNLTATMGAGHVVANPSNATFSCPGATLSAIPGAAIVTMTGGSISGAITECSASFDVVTPVSDGSATNVIYSTTVTNNEGVLANDGTGNANAQLTRYVNNVTVNNSFTPAVVATNGTSVLAIQINNNNTNATALTNVGLIDALPAGLVIAAPAQAQFTGAGCTGGTITATPNSSTLTLAGASIARNAQCVLSVNVKATSAGNLVNTIAAGTLTTNTGSTNPALSTATLTATGSADLSITVTDGVTQVATGGTTTYTVTVSNAGPDAIAGLQVVDSAPAQMTFTGWTCTTTGTSTCPAASGTGNLDATVFVSVNGTVTFSITGTVATNASGTITNTATMTIPSGVTNTSSSPPSASDTDTVIPGAPVITFPAAGGQVGPNPLVTGVGQPGATLSVYEGMSVLCITTVNPQGNWSCNSALQPGSHTLTARQSDALNNTSQLSTAVTFTVIAPPSIAITTPGGINSMNASSYTVSGTCTTSAGTVSLAVGTVISSAPCTAGAFTKTVNAVTVADGAVTITASQTNVAGTVSDSKNTVKDSTVVPPVIATPANNAMVSPQPTFTGTGEPGSTVTVRDGANPVCTATTGSTGNWSCVSTLSTGTHTVTATQTDVAGNVSGPSTAVTLTIVSQAPNVTVNALAPIAAANANAYPVSGSCSAFAGSVTVTVGTVTVTTPCNSGSYSTTVNVSALPDALVVSVSASQTNVLGTATGTGSTRKDTVSTPPVITAPGDGTTVALNPTITGTAEANAVVTVKEGATPVCTATANALGQWSCASTLVGGSHTISATAVDSVGNTSNLSSPVTFTVVSGPALILNTPAAISSANASSYTVSGQCLSSSGMVTVTVRTVNGTAACTNGQFTLTLDVSGVPDGAVVPIVATQGSATDTKSAVKDTSAQPPAILVPAANATVPRNPVISGTAEANASVTVKEGTTTVCTTLANASGAWSCLSTLDVGTHSITATQTDAVGNVSQASASRTFTVTSGAGLAVSVTQPGPVNASNAAAFVITGQCTTSAGDVAVTIGTITATANCVNGAFTTTQNLSTLADAPALTFGASQTDVNGTFTDTKTALKDTVVVAPVISAPAANGMVAVNPTLSGTSEPGATVTVKEGSTVVCTAIADTQGAWSCVSTLATGTHAITATQTDVAGNVSAESAPTSFTVTSLPVVTVTPTPVNAMNKSAYPMAGNCSTGAGSVTVTVGAVTQMVPCTNGMYTTTLDVTAVPDGAMVAISASQTNASGTGSDNRTVIKDTVPPASPVVTNPPAGSTLPTVTSLTGTSEPNSTVTVTLDGVVVGSALTDSNGNWTVTLSNPPVNGEHTVTAVATDRAGNPSPASAAQTFTIGTATPTVITTPADGSSAPADTALAVTGTGPKNSTITVFVDGEAVGTTTSDANGAWAFSVPGSKFPAGQRKLAASAAGGVLSATVNVTATGTVTMLGNVRYSGGGVGCSASGSMLGLWLALAALTLVRRRR